MIKESVTWWGNSVLVNCDALCVFYYAVLKICLESKCSIVETSETVVFNLLNVIKGYKIDAEIAYHRSDL